MLSGNAGQHKTLLVTSPAVGCGKTSVSVNMAMTFVAEGKRVLFIDTNFRRPTSSVLFGRAETAAASQEHPDFGLSNYLMGQCEYNNVIRPSDIEGLDVIDSGPMLSTPSEQLASIRMTDLLTKGKDQYDYVVIDGPPMLVSDAKAMAAMADGTIVVFNATMTRRGEAQRTLRELNRVNANVIGTVLVGTKSIKGGYFNEMYKSYQQYQEIPAKV